MLVRCPHCQATIETVADSNLTDLGCPSCGSRVNLSAADTETYGSHTTRTLGHFELIDMVGKGAFGSVWRAKDVQLDRTVAIKMPRKDQLAPEEVALFLREARAAAQLNHPNIVSVHEVGRDGDHLYIVSDFVRGVTLSDHLTAGRMHRDEACRICITVARALHHAHQAGVIHRDLKPGNIMLDQSGQPYLMDFGLARREVGDATLTLEGKILGTPAYMSPEQARGNAHTADRRSDIYSLGVILYQLLVGELPFRGNPQMLILQIIRDEPPSPRKFDATLPRDLETICLKSLDKAPDKRYATAEEMADDLQRFLDGHPIHARPLGRIERAWRWRNRNPAVANLLALSATLLVLVAVVSLVAYVRTAAALRLAKWNAAEAQHARREAIDLAGRERQSREDAQQEKGRAEALAASERAARKQADAARQEAERAVEEAQQVRQRLQEALVEAQAATGLVEAKYGRPELAALWFASAADAAAEGSPQQMMNLRRAALWSRTNPAVIRSMLLPSGPERPGRPHIQFDHTGELLLAWRPRGQAVLWHWPTDRRLVLPGDPLLAATLHPSRPWVVVAWASGRLEIRSTEDLSLVSELQIAELIEHIELDHRGEQLALATFQPPLQGVENAQPAWQVRFWKLGSEQLEPVTLDHDAPITAMQFSPDGRRLATAARDFLARVFDSQGPQAGQLVFAPVTHRPNPNGRWLAPHFVAAGRELLTLESPRVIQWRNATTGQPLAKLQTPQGNHTIDCLTNAPGETMVAVGGFQFLMLLDVSQRRRLRWVNAHANRIESMDFRADGGLVATSSIDGSCEFWYIHGERRGRVKQTGEVAQIAFGPSGQHLAVAQYDGLLQIRHDPDARLQPVDLPIAGNFSGGRVSPDGQHLALSGHHLDCALFETRVFRLADQRAAGPMLAVEGLLLNARFSPDGQRLAAVSGGDVVGGDNRRFLARQHGRPGRVQLFDWRTGQPSFAPVTTPSLPLDVVFSRDGKRMFVACAQGELLGIDTADGEVVFEAPADARIPLHLFHLEMFVDTRWLALSPDERWLISAGHRSGVLVRSAETGELRYPVLKHDTACFDFDLHPDGSVLATGSLDGTVQFWEFADGTLRPAKLGHPDWIFQSRFSPDGSQLVTACRDGYARLWNWPQGTLATPPLQHDGEVFAAAFIENGTFIATLSLDLSCRVWDAHRGRPLGPPTVLRVIPYRSDLSADGRFLIASGNSSDKLQTIDLQPLLGPATLPPQAALRDAALQAGYGLLDQQGTYPLTTAEWLELWEQHRDERRTEEDTVLAGDPAAVAQQLERWRFVEYLGQEHRGNVNAALVHLDALLAATPDNVDLLTRRAMLLRRNDPERAAADAQRAIQLGEDTYALWYIVHVAAAYRGDWEADRVALDELIRLRPQRWLYRLDRAECHARGRRWAEALEDLRQTERLGGTTTDFWLRYALYSLAAKDLPQYREVCRRVLTRYAGVNEVGTLRTVAWVCALGPGAMEDYAEALAVTRQTVANEPDRLSHQWTLAAMLYRAGRSAEAQDVLAPLLTADPANPTGSAEPLAALLAALIHRDLNDDERSQAWLNAARRQIAAPSDDAALADVADSFDMDAHAYQLCVAVLLAEVDADAEGLAADQPAPAQLEAAPSAATPAAAEARPAEPPPPEPR